MCTQLSDQYEKAKSHEGRAAIAKLKAQHDGQVERERKAYHDARLSARQDPTETTCIIIDGMDQSKTSIPHFVVEDKDNANLAKLPVHFTGVLVHTASPEGKIPFIYHDIKHIPHDSNLTIHCITETLNELKDRLGKTLFLQMDNCGRENKNKYVLSYIALLVHLGIFKEALVHFLPVGHTHEDIDQMFSCVARQLRTHNAFTMADLERQSSQSYKPSIKIVPVTMVQDVKCELSTHMAGGFTNHSKPLWFRFTKVQESTFMHYKLHVDDAWKPTAESEWHMGLKCLKSCPDISASLNWVATSLEKTDFDKLCQDLPHAYNTRLPTVARQWWIDFLSNGIRAKYEKVPSSTVWTLHQLLPREVPTNTEAPDDVENICHIQSHILQECPEICIGSQGKPRSGVTRVADFSSMKEGMMSAVYCEQTDGRPHIATITEISSDGVTVSWMKGSWTGAWNPWIIRQKGQSKPYTSLVPQNSLILWDFYLTTKKRLRQETARELKAIYADLDSERDL